MTIPVEGFNINKALGFGRSGDHNPIENIRSFAAEEDDIEFGHAVMDGTDAEKQVKLFASATGKFRGVAGYSVDASNIDNSLFDEGDSVPVFDQGVVTVYVEEAVNVGDAVRVRHDATGPGNFRTSADAGKSVLLTGAEWREDGASGTAVKLFLNPPFTVTAD
jgi:hypothetical protein